jgi:DNA-binding beta-propeller fold protein YncE
MHTSKKSTVIAVVASVALLTGDPAAMDVWAGEPQPAALGTLVAYEPLPAACAVPAEEQRVAMRHAARAQRNAVTATVTAPVAADTFFNSPLRSIKDAYPSFASVAVDPVRDEVVFTDESLFQVLVYDRLEDALAGAEASQPKRSIAGERTNIEFQSGAYVDPETGEIYAVNNDTRDTTVIFPPGANGDVLPSRGIVTPHGAFGIAVAEAHDEILITIQHDAAIVAYEKTAGGDDSPIRLLQGSRTRLADPHGIAYDPKDDVIFVANFGSRHDVSPDLEPRTGVGSTGNEEGKTNWPLGREWAISGSGTIGGPSISVYRRTASGDEPPLRVIEGPATQFDWPTGLAFDPKRRELFVANDMGPSILVFDAAAEGDVAPKRVLKGPRTSLANPTGVAVDTKNRELWVANFGGHSATVYDLTAEGDTPPLRTIRNAPQGTPSLMIGNPGAVTYDTTRKEILVPN